MLSVEIKHEGLKLSTVIFSTCIEIACSKKPSGSEIDHVSVIELFPTILVSKISSDGKSSTG